eukprot:2446478-Prymnesium_polylepis.2
MLVVVSDILTHDDDRSASECALLGLPVLIHRGGHGARHYTKRGGGGDRAPGQPRPGAVWEARLPPVRSAYGFHRGAQGGFRI